MSEESLAVQKWLLDHAILEERGRIEPPPNESDIHSLAVLRQFRGKIVKYTSNQGQTWRYAKLSDREPGRFSDGSYGLRTYEEVLPNARVDALSSLTQRQFREEGLVVRGTKLEEIRKLVFSDELGGTKRNH